MKKYKTLLAAAVTGLLLSSCSNNKATEKNTQHTSTEVTLQEPKAERPATTETELRSKVYAFDSKVADVSRSLRNLKSDIEKGVVLTPTITDNITGMITDAKKMREPLLSVSNQLAAEEFRVFDRDKDWISKLETEFESLRQTK